MREEIGKGLIDAVLEAVGMVLEELDMYNQDDKQAIMIYL